MYFWPGITSRFPLSFSLSPFFPSHFLSPSSTITQPIFPFFLPYFDDDAFFTHRYVEERCNNIDNPCLFASFSRSPSARFPFYYEIKTILVIWLLSPATKGSSILYRRFVHPALIQREAEIDEALARATEQGYTAVLHLGSKGVNYATTVLMQTAIKVSFESFDQLSLL